MNAKAEWAKQWLIKADDDIRLAQFIMDGDDPIYWAVGFHAQQCTEKALKGFLTFHDIRAKKSHDVGYLLQLCSEVLSVFEKFKTSAGQLTEYAVDSRYPAPHGQVNKEKATQAIETARSIYEFTLKSLPELAED